MDRKTNGAMRRRQEKEVTLTPESIDGYLEHLRSAGRVQGTLDSYRRKIGRLYQTLPEEDKSIRQDTLPWWREKLAEEGYSAAGINQFVIVVNGYLGYMGARELQVTDRLESAEEPQLELTRSEYLRLLSAARSFKVESKRADKTFPMTSIQLSQYVGGELHDRFPHLAADMHRPELTVHVEVRDFDAYVHADPEPGAGGLPVGMGGRALSLLSGGIDSPVASWMIAKRGVIVDMIHYYSYPYTSPEAKEKVLELARLLVPYTGKQCVHVVPFTKIQEELRRSCPEELFTILMRRFMMRIACRVAEKNGIHALVTGESVGQVASQTLDAMVCTDAVCTLPVLRPLVGMDKEEIVRVSRKIGTFETSILPYEDCCTVFTPKHPRTKPKPEELDEAEQALDVEAMVEDAVAGIERIMLDL